MKTSDLESCYSFTDKYSYFIDNVTIHIGKRGCFLVCPNPKLYYDISQNIANFFAKCNGNLTIGELIIKQFYKKDNILQKELLEDMLFISGLIKDGIIMLSDVSINKLPKIIEDSKYYIPSNVQFEITKSCNLKCFYCYRLADKNEVIQPIPTEQILLKLSELADFGISSIEITGGEPFFHPDIIKIISLCYQKFVLIGVLTNGTLINETTIEELEPFKDKLAISVSLDCHIPEMHDSRRGMKGAFNKTTNAIKLLSQSGFLTKVSMVIDKDNWTYIEPTLLLAKEFGASTFGYSPVLPFGRGENCFEFWDSFVNDFIKLSTELSLKYPDYLNINSDTLELQKPGGCGAGFRVFAINPIGEVRPCVTFDELSISFGNIYKDKFENIFGGESLDWFSNSFVPIPKYCSGCVYEFFCRYCILRGLLASKWLGQGNCNWLNKKENQNLSKLIFQ